MPLHPLSQTHPFSASLGFFYRSEFLLLFAIDTFFLPRSLQNRTKGCDTK